jgi:hypothetical protein
MPKHRHYHPDTATDNCDGCGRTKDQLYVNVLTAKGHRIQANNGAARRAIPAEHVARNVPIPGSAEWRRLVDEDRASRR